MQHQYPRTIDRLWIRTVPTGLRCRLRREIGLYCLPMGKRPLSNLDEFPCPSEIYLHHLVSDITAADKVHRFNRVVHATCTRTFTSNSSLTRPAMQLENNCLAQMEITIRRRHLRVRVVFTPLGEIEAALTTSYAIITDQAQALLRVVDLTLTPVHTNVTNWTTVQRSYTTNRHKYVTCSRLLTPQDHQLGSPSAFKINVQRLARPRRQDQSPRPAHTRRQQQYLLLSPPPPRLALTPRQQRPRP